MEASWQLFAVSNLISTIGHVYSFVILHGIYARLAQSAERKALNLVVVGSSPTVGVDAQGGASRDSNPRGKTPSA